MRNTRSTGAPAFRVVVAAALALAGVSAGGAVAQEYSFRLPHVTSSTEPINDAALFFAEKVEERSNGRIVIEVFPGGQLGTNPEIYEQVSLGAPLIIIADTGYLSDFVPDLGVLNGPSLLDQPQDFKKILDSDWFSELLASVREESNFELLTLNWFFGDRNVIAHKPVTSVADFEGLSIRVPPNTMWI